MYKNIFNNLFQEFIDKNSFLVVNSRIKNYTISSYDFTNISRILPNEKILLKNMLSDDTNQFNEIRKSLSNEKIKNNITSAYCLLFNECVNINNELHQKNLICSALEKYLSNIKDEIKMNILVTLEDKMCNNQNFNLSQLSKKNKKDLRITIELLFLIFVYMVNKYQNIIDTNQVIKGIIIKDLITTKIKEELYLILILQQNLYWIDILCNDLLSIFYNLKNNKFRMLINADNEFNNLDEDFKMSCLNRFIPLFNIIKKYSSIKTNKNLSRCTIIDSLFDLNSHNNNIINNNNSFIPLRINQIDKVIIKLFECFIYEFLYDIDYLWKYFDYLNYNLVGKFPDNNIQFLYGFGTYLCSFVKSVAFIRDDNTTKIDFFNFYIFSYNLITNYFSRLNSHLYNLLTDVYDIIVKNNCIMTTKINLNYLQNLSNALKDMLFHFMIFSFYNDSLKDIYSYNEILFNAIISHCFLKSIIPIYSLIINGNNDHILFDILFILIDNVAKYKILLPLKSHFHKELFTHNFLIILDYFLNKYEEKLTLLFKEKKKSEVYHLVACNLKYRFNKILCSLFDHYNCINFIYSNHIMYMLNKILNNSCLTKYDLDNNIILRYIPNDKNSLYYKDIKLTLIQINNTNNNSFKPINAINVNNNDNSQNKNEPENKIVGYSLENNFDKNTIKLLDQINLDEYDFVLFEDKKYFVKLDMSQKNQKNLNYSNIIANNGNFIEILGIDKKLNENILKIMENIQYTDKYIFKLIQEKIINNDHRIKVSGCFHNNLKYYDLTFKMNYFQYQNQIKEFLL